MYGVSGLACDESRWSYQGRAHTIPQGRWVKKGITNTGWESQVLMLYEKSADP